MEELINTLEYIQSNIIVQLNPILNELKNANEVRISLNKLTAVMNSFSDDLAKKVKLKSAEKIVDTLNDLSNKVDILGENLLKQYEVVLAEHQKEFAQEIQQIVSSNQEIRLMLIKRIESFDIKQLEQNIETDIKKRLDYFPFEDMKSLNKVVDMEKQLEVQYRIYQKYFEKIKEQNEEMKEIASWNKEHIGGIEVSYIIISFAFGYIASYSNIVFKLLGLEY